MVFIEIGRVMSGFHDVGERKHNAGRASILCRVGQQDER